MMFKFHIHEYLHIRENFHILYFYNDFIRVFITGLPYPDIFLYPEIFHVPENILIVSFFSNLSKLQDLILKFDRHKKNIYSQEYDLFANVLQ